MFHASPVNLKILFYTMQVHAKSEGAKLSFTISTGYKNILYGKYQDA